MYESTATNHTSVRMNMQIKTQSKLQQTNVVQLELFSYGLTEIFQVIFMHYSCRLQKCTVKRSILIYFFIWAMSI